MDKSLTEMASGRGMIAHHIRDEVLTALTELAKSREDNAKLERYSAEGLADVGRLMGEIAESQAREERLRESASPFAGFLGMLEADRECCDEEPYADSDVVVSFMGSGASDMLTVGDFRKLHAALARTKEDRLCTCGHPESKHPIGYNEGCLRIGCGCKEFSTALQGEREGDSDG